MKDALIKLLNKYQLSGTVQNFLYGYFSWFALTLVLFLLTIGFDYILENISTSNDTVGVTLFVVKYFMHFGLYLSWILIAFFTLATFIILVFLTLITKVFYMNDLTLLEITLVRLEEIITLKRYWIVYIIIALIIMILADNQMFGLDDLF